MSRISDTLDIPQVETDVVCRLKYFQTKSRHILYILLLQNAQQNEILYIVVFKSLYNKNMQNCGIKHHTRSIVNSYNDKLSKPSVGVTLNSHSHSPLKDFSEMQILRTQTTFLKRTAAVTESILIYRNLFRTRSPPP